MCNFFYDKALYLRKKCQFISVTGNNIRISTLNFILQKIGYKAITPVNAGQIFKSRIFRSYEFRERRVTMRVYTCY